MPSKYCFLCHSQGMSRLLGLVNDLVPGRQYTVEKPPLGDLFGKGHQSLSILSIATYTIYIYTIYIYTHNYIVYIYIHWHICIYNSHPIFPYLISETNQFASPADLRIPKRTMASANLAWHQKLAWKVENRKSKMENLPKKWLRNIIHSGFGPSPTKSLDSDDNVVVYCTNSKWLCIKHHKIVVPACASLFHLVSSFGDVKFLLLFPCEMFVF